MMTDYDDLIDLPHPTAHTRRPMSNAERAAQFAPFAALSSHAETLEDTAAAVERSQNEK